MQKATDVAASPPLPGGPASTGDALHSYLSAIAAIPLLHPGEEKQLAHRWRDQRDVAAARKLVLANLRFVAYVARDYAGYGLALGDLIQEGNIGLMKAVKRFDPSKGVRLISFAVHWIRAEIHEFILRNWRIVRVATTKAQRKLFFRLRGLKPHLGWMTPPEVDAVARALTVTPEDVRTMEARLVEHDASFDAAAADDGPAAPEHFLAGEASPEAELQDAQSAELHAGQLKQALAALDHRARDIVTQRWLYDGEKARLRDLAQKYGVSAERVRQIEEQALARMRGAVTSAGA